MNLEHRYSYYTLIIIFCISLGITAVQVNSQIEMEQTSSSNTSYPFTLTDGLGRNVTFTEEPQKVISIAPSATEIIFAVGAGDKVIAVDFSSNYPNETASLPKVNNFPSIDLEALLVLNPDLVFGAGITSNEDVAAMENQGIQVFILAPFTITEVLDDIGNVGQILNHVTEASTLKDSIQSRLDSVLVNTSSLSYRPKVYLEFASDPLYTFGKGTYGHDLIELAGGINIAENATDLYPLVDNEFVITSNPDIILYSKGSWTTTNSSSISARVGWGAITAVKNGMIFPINEDWVSRGGPRIIDGLEAIHSRVQEVLRDKESSLVDTSSSTKINTDIIPFQTFNIFGILPILAVIVFRRLHQL